MTTFDDFGLDEKILESLKNMGYTSPTPIQEVAISLILEGHDLIALAETGSGKTAACAIPICSRVDTTQPHVQALIIAPTRELALQYAVETQKIGRYKGVKAFAILGGEDAGLQSSKLRAGVHVLIATPGRLIDFIYQRAIDLTHVNTLILDEADEMLGMGFYEDLEFIMDCLVQEHQTLLFSATMPKEIRQIAQRHMRTPKEVTLTKSQATPDTIEHLFYYCDSPRNKTEDLIRLLRQVDPHQTLIFCKARHEVESITRTLKGHLSHVDYLHGGLAQGLRTVITNKFRSQKIRYLVATDVAARGLDFSGVTHVINVHLPLDTETYLHRAGRTGRSGRKGECVSLVTRRDLPQVRKILTVIKREPKWLTGPPPPA